MRRAMWLALFLLMGCSSPEPEPSPKQAAVTPPERRRETPKVPGFDDVEYAPGRRLDIYLPQPRGANGAQAKTFYPTVVLIHGGGWVSGSRSELRPHAERLNKKGLAAVSIDYRLATSDVWPAQLEDCRLAIDWLKKNGRDRLLNTDRLIAAGESAGAHLSMWLAVKGDVQGVGSISGLHDLTLPMTPTGESYQIVQKALGPNYPKDVKAFSPLLSYKKRMPPVFFIHGEKDPWVPTKHSTQAATKLNELEIENKVILVPEMGHGLRFQDRVEQAAWDQFADWARQLLRS